MNKPSNPPKIISASPPPVRLQLARDRVQALKRGHPWIFADVLLDLPKSAPGSLAILKDKSGEVIAQGMFDPSSHLAFRVCALNPERFDDTLARNRMQSAWALRRAVINEATQCYRLLNGEGDRLPGLVCDVYGEYAVIQLDGAGPQGFWDLNGIAETIIQLGGPRNIYRKARSGDAVDTAAVIAGEAPPSATVVREHGLLFEVNLLHGQKTGFFLDQRDNRLRIQSLARGRKVLNLFGYTGGFSIYAGAGGAKEVTTVDRAKPAIATAIDNWRLNGFPDGQHAGVAADCFQYLEDAHIQKREWDLVIVDPPSFAPGKHHIDKATSAYTSIFASALKVTAAGGIFAASSCSSHISPEAFLSICEEAVSKARRRATILGIYGQPEDHPFPLVCRELQYLKFVLLNVE